MTKTLLISLATAALCAAGPTSGASPEAAKKIVTEVCQACHGADGNSPTPDYPKLGGQGPDYLAKTLRDYKSGARKNPIMAGFASNLSKQDIENLAAYYGSQPPVLVVKH